jgi:hypothetical protein
MDREENLKVASRLVSDSDNGTKAIAAKMGGIDWTPDEYLMLHTALDLESKDLNHLISTALWEQDRTRTHVMIGSFDYCGILLESGLNRSNTSGLLRTYQQSVAGMWVQNTRTALLREESYVRLSHTLNANFLLKELSLDRYSRFVSGDSSVRDRIIASCFEHNDAIRDALPTIIEVFALHSSVTWKQRPQSDDLLDIAALIAEHPGAGDFVVAHAKERNAYDGQAIRDALNNGTLSLSSGVL